MRGRVNPQLDVIAVITESKLNNQTLLFLRVSGLRDYTYTCGSICCRGSEISQPVDKTLMMKTENRRNMRKRYFSPVWYKKFSWMHFCSSSLTIYCFYCKAATTNNVTIMSKKNGSCFYYQRFF